MVEHVRINLQLLVVLFASVQVHSQGISVNRVRVTKSVWYNDNYKDNNYNNDKKKNNTNDNNLINKNNKNSKNNTYKDDVKVLWS